MVVTSISWSKRVCIWSGNLSSELLELLDNPVEEAEREMDEFGDREACA